MASAWSGAERVRRGRPPALVGSPLPIAIGGACSRPVRFLLARSPMLRIGALLALCWAAVAFLDRSLAIALWVPLLLLADLPPREPGIARRLRGHRAGGAPDARGAPVRDVRLARSPGSPHRRVRRARRLAAAVAGLAPQPGVAGKTRGQMLRAACGSLVSFWRALDRVDAVRLLGHPLAVAFALLATARRRSVILRVGQDVPASIRNRMRGGLTSSSKRKRWSQCAEPRAAGLGVARWSLGPRAAGRHPLRMTVRLWPDCMAFLEGLHRLGPADGRASVGCKPRVGRELHELWLARSLGGSGSPPRGRPRLRGAVRTEPVKPRGLGQPATHDRSMRHARQLREPESPVIAATHCVPPRGRCVWPSSSGDVGKSRRHQGRRE